MSIGGLLQQCWRLLPTPLPCAKSGHRSNPRGGLSTTDAHITLLGRFGHCDTKHRAIQGAHSRFWKMTILHYVAGGADSDLRTATHRVGILQSSAMKPGSPMILAPPLWIRRYLVFLAGFMMFCVFGAPASWRTGASCESGIPRPLTYSLGDKRLR